MRDFQNHDVLEKFSTFNGVQGEKLRRLRELIFDVAASDPRIGALSEELRWGDPSYITAVTKAGSTVRLGLFGKNKIALFFHCKTTLVQSFRETYGDALEYSKNRAIILDPTAMPDESILTSCVHASLTYKL